ncbi:MAG TPA: nucleotidyltransferase family protein [Acidobacteriaceae bacterium]|jgi:hypothetical protein|nr:nucleotidyltransferase family protein [Acidobacteriaceae bacterium]
MGWVSRSHPQLVAAIVASFSAPRDEALRRLSAFAPEQWARTESWLDTSGLALYFAEVAHTRRLEGAVDPALLARLQYKMGENRKRLAEMLRDFCAINQSFHSAGIHYVNLKGFTAYPDSCPDLSLRHQSDFDFLVAPADLTAARALLETQGYKLTGATPHSLEFRSGSWIRKSLAGQYQARYRPSAELHMAGAAAAPDPRLARLATWSWEGRPFPCLAPADQLIGQGLHLLGHLRNEHTRVSWLLEYRHFVRARRNDSVFWSEVRTLANERPDAATALGLSTLLANALLGSFSPPQLNVWTVDQLAPGVRQWAEQYGRKAVLADVPGTKLYLLLEEALRELPGKDSLHRTRRLIPLRFPRRMLPPIPRTSLRQRMRRGIAELQFLAFRLRFHLREGLRFLVEARRWKRLRASGPHPEKTSLFRRGQVHSE